MSIFESIFGKAPTAPVAVPTPAQIQQAQAQAAATPGNMPADTAVRVASTSSAGTAPNGAVPAGTDTEGKAGKSGLDAFSDLFQTDPNAPKQEPGQPLFNVTPEKLMESARKQDFRPKLTVEQATAVAAGGQEAVAAMVEIMNDVAQRVYAQSADATTKLIMNGLERSNFAKSDDIGTIIRNSSISNSLREENPLFSNPAVAPMLDMVKSQMLVKFPKATTAEIADMSKNYLTAFAEAALKPAKDAETAAATAKKSKGGSDTDWSSFA